MFESFRLATLPALEQAVNTLSAQGVPEDEIAERVGQCMYAGVEKGSAVFLRKLKRQTNWMLADRKRSRDRFQSHLRRVWGRGFDAMRTLIEAAREAGEEFERYHGESHHTPRDPVLEVLQRLHARACLKASEVLWLMEGGFASGALARWRPLHELAVVAFFVKHHGPDVAERFLLHTHIETYKEALQYQAHFKRLGATPPKKRDLDRLKRRRDELCDRFGSSYAKDWGWAAIALGNDNPRFVDIEERADLKHLRPYFKISSYFTHAGSKGLFFNPGTVEIPEEPEILLAGPSDAGLYDAGACTAISLAQVTTVLLTHDTESFLAMILASTIQKLAIEADGILAKAKHQFFDNVAKHAARNGQRTRQASRKQRAKSPN